MTTAKHQGIVDEMEREEHLKTLAIGVKYQMLLSKHNRLIDTINRKGGQKFLDNGVVLTKSQQAVSELDASDLIRLCHPDKHSGNALSTEITAKLIIARKS